MNSQSRRNFTPHYSMIQFVFGTAISAVMGYATVYMLARDISPELIGIFFSVTNIIGVLVQPFIAGILENSKRLNVVTLAQILCLVAAAALFMVLFVNNPILFFILYAVPYVVSISMMTPMNALSGIIENKGLEINFGFARATSSLSFATFTSLLGLWVSQFSTNVILYVGIFGYLSLAVVYQFVPIKWILSLSDNIHSFEGDGDQASMELEGRTGMDLRFIFFLISGALLITFHAISNSYLIQIIESIGGNVNDMGLAMTIAAGSEIPIMVLFKKLVERIPVEKLLVISAFMFFVKAIITLFATSMPMLYVAAAFQMGGFGLFLPASVHYVNIKFLPQDNARGQAYAASSLTMGNILGSAIGGFVLGYWSPQVLLLVSVVSTILGIFSMIVAVRQRPRIAVE